MKRRDAEQWMSHRLLPETLRERIRRYEQYKWQETRGVDEENLICNLPKDLRRDIKRHLCLALLMRVSPLASLCLFLRDCAFICIFPLRICMKSTFFFGLFKLYCLYHRFEAGLKNTIYLLLVVHNDQKEC